MIVANSVNAGVARAKIIEPERSALRVIPVARALIQKIMGILGHFKMDAADLVDERFNLRALQYVKYMVININRRRDSILPKPLFMFFNKCQLSIKMLSRSPRIGVAKGNFPGDIDRRSKRLRHSTATSVPFGENIF